MFSAPVLTAGRVSLDSDNNSNTCMTFSPFMSLTAFPITAKIYDFHHSRTILSEQWYEKCVSDGTNISSEYVKFPICCVLSLVEE